VVVQSETASESPSIREPQPDRVKADICRYVEAREAEEQVKASAARDPYVARVHRQLATLYRKRRETLAAGRS
jgi:hypothetical protein